MKHRSLATRLVISHLLVIVVVFGIAAAVLLAQSREYFINADRRALLVQARTAAKACDDVCLATGAGDFNVSNSQFPSAAIVTQNRSNSEANLRVSPNSPSDRRIQAALNSAVRVLRVSEAAPSTMAAIAQKGRSSSGIVGDELVAAAPILRTGSVVGAIEIRSDLTNVNAVIGDLRRRVLGALSIGAFLAALLGLWRARSIATPLRALTTAARSVADGHFDHEIAPARGSDEITELTRTFVDMRDQVQRELALRNQFVADASHELRTPLTAIKGAVEILEDGGADRPEVRTRFLAALKRETSRLLGLVEDLLQLQQPSSDSLDIAATPVDVTELARAVAEDLAPVAARSSVQISVSSSCDPVLSQGDEPRIRQVILNLIDNAIAFSPQNSTVMVRVSAHDKSALVEIEDKGPGIPLADRERVFERFVRLDKSRANHNEAARRSGSGLGLAIAQGIAHAHGGTITLSEGSGGIGTRALLTLPLRVS